MKLPSNTKTKQPSGSRAPFYWQGQFCKWPALLSKDHDRFTDSWLSIPRVLRQQQIEGCTHDHNKVCVHVMYKSRQRSKHVRRCDDCNKSRPFKPSVEYVYIYIICIYSLFYKPSLCRSMMTTRDALLDIRQNVCLPALLSSSWCVAFFCTWKMRQLGGHKAWMAQWGTNSQTKCLGGSTEVEESPEQE